MSEKIVLTRNQLAKFLPNPETIKAFENLFRISTQINPDIIAQLTLLVEEANNVGNSGLSSSIYLESMLDEKEKKILSVSSNTSVPIGNYCIIADATIGSINITLPLASSAIFKTVSVTKKDISANTVTILPSGTDTIIGSSSQILLYDSECLELVSDGTNWQIGG